MMASPQDDSAREPFDRIARRRARTRAAPRYADFAFLKDAVAEDLAARAEELGGPYRRLLDLGAHDGRAGCAIPVAQRVFADSAFAFAAPLGGVVCDEDRLPFRDGSFDIVVSALSLHGVNDLPGTLVQVRRLLRPGGVFLAALVGGHSLGAVRQALAQAEIAATGAMAPRLHPTVDAAAAPGLLQRAGFAQPVVDVSRMTLTYRAMEAMRRDLLGMGEGNVLSGRERRGLGRPLAAQLAAAVAEALGPPPMHVDLEILTLTGLAPAAP